ncbi:WhiB transcriptional factor [Gordonia phage Ronaldo]|uniref:WhiB family transcription factor n=4 Tax=Ronaldovirus TaxID=2733205 RepID=A0A6B9L8D4_9CAUD|nr:WhiB transcriptional factor [Gordonia phage Fryberger]YP_009807792.1 WhiB transcriptional factor [Gordonia phage Ronaldo]QDH48434.1 WhiB family transcription factor [Gordonia phage Ziko]QHB38212.1 WhiB family transcription factor [Gordonia phage Volt]AXN53510.1 WhiB family transcription factor [Gordonia phage Fryberger]AXN53658.1 WhiB family transcription factor [Gordonia phage Ronaldo]
MFHYEEWEDDALCKQVGTEPFFPEKFEGSGNIGYAFRVCAACPVVEECLQFAIDHQELAKYGIWGGTTPKWRQEYREAMGIKGIDFMPSELGWVRDGRELE